MPSDVLIDGWIGADPVDYPATTDKQRFARFDVAERPPRAAKRGPNWITVNAYGSVADKIIDGLEIRRGDHVRVTGFLASRHARAACGSHHRFTVVVARDLIYISGSKTRPHLQYADEPPPPWFQAEDPLDIFSTGPQPAKR